MSRIPTFQSNGDIRGRATDLLIQVYADRIVQVSKESPGQLSTLPSTTESPLPIDPLILVKPLLGVATPLESIYATQIAAILSNDGKPIIVGLGLGSKRGEEANEDEGEMMKDVKAFVTKVWGTGLRGT
ncbi:hypothetical protein BT69DRAFT_1306311, partial [Atractiella rhizophila]